MSISTAAFARMVERYRLPDGSLDEGELLRENPSLDCLYALSKLREGLLEWYGFREGASLLQIGADSGALTGLFLEKGLEAEVLEEDPEEAEKLCLRYPGVHVIAELVKTYDYIVAAGSLDLVKELGQAEEAAGNSPLEACLAHLNPGGVMILACDNVFGIRYLTGSAIGPGALSRKDLEAWAGEGAEWYYPMPDWRLPSGIYSDDRLPAEGELSRVIRAYGDSEFVTADPGAMYDRVCREGSFPEFANSFLVILQK